MGFFLWPEGRRRPPAHSGGTAPADVETALLALFPGTGHPVAVSSGRSGLAMALGLMGLTRPDLVRVPPYASHCVLEAVSRVATPLAAAASAPAAAQVIYHQWGYVQDRVPGDGEAVDDACDSLCDPGARLFPADGRFEIWSLPKIVGARGGGVVWCRNENDAARLRDMRDTRHRGALAQWMLRIGARRFPPLGDYWAGRETLCGYPVRGAVADMLAAIEDWRDLARIRRARLELTRSCRPDWLRPGEARLPCVVPLEPGADLEQRLRELGIETGLRHFERARNDGSVELVKVLPLPIHQDVPDAVLERAVRLAGAAMTRTTRV